MDPWQVVGWLVAITLAIPIVILIAVIVIFALAWVYDQLHWAYLRYKRTGSIRRPKKMRYP